MKCFIFTDNSIPENVLHEVLKPLSNAINLILIINLLNKNKMRSSRSFLTCIRNKFMKNIMSVKAHPDFSSRFKEPSVKTVILSENGHIIRK